ATLLEFARRFFQEAAAGSETSVVGLETVSADAGLLLRHLDETTANELLSHLAATQPLLPPKAAFYLWAGVVHGIGEAATSRNSAINRLEEFLVLTALTSHRDIDLLSAILGLGCLKSPRVRQEAARLSKRDWSGPVRRWLVSLAEGQSYPYPDDD